jgi:drug/metabolite transporter (DMT)-like permease
MAGARTAVLTSLAMVAFAGNSLLCRLALRNTSIDAASFTAIRLVAGAAMLWLLLTLRRDRPAGKGNWPSALALFVYAAAFSYAYLGLPAGTGALLLFGAVQASMISYGIWRGERPRPAQWVGLALAGIGLVALILPGLSAPPLKAALLMLSAGMAWGVYSLRGRSAGAPLPVTAGNFLRAAVIAVALALAMWSHLTLDSVGAVYALASGALASGIGYAIWYSALPGLPATSAASVQLSVPLLAALGGIVFLDETVTLRLLLAALAILGGIALVIFERRDRGWRR